MPKEKNNKGPVLIGLTGGIGSGKSTVLKFLRKKGVATVDSDAIVHDILRSNRRVLGSIRRRFGKQVFDKEGRLNKRKLAARVFVSKNNRRYLEGLIHPLVRKTIWKKVAARKGGRVVVDVPLLYESGWKKKFNLVIVVNASTSRRMARLKKKGFSTDDIKRRIRAQWLLPKKVRMADFVVDNNLSKSYTRKQINTIWKIIVTRKG